MKKNLEEKKLVKNLKIKKPLDRFVTYYTGETINGVPCGKGTSETYDSVKGIDNKVHKIKGEEWFKYNQWMRDPVLSECWAKVHWQLNKEYILRYSKEYYREVEKRVYIMRPELMKKYYSHNN